METLGDVCDGLNVQIRNSYGSVLLIKNRSVCMFMKKLFTKAINKGLRNPGRNGEAPGASEEPKLP